MHVYKARLEQSGKPVVQIVYGDIHVDGEFSGDARLGQSSVEVTVMDPEMDAFRFDVSDALRSIVTLIQLCRTCLRLQR